MTDRHQPIVSQTCYPLPHTALPLLPFQEQTFFESHFLIIANYMCQTFVLQLSVSSPSLMYNTLLELYLHDITHLEQPEVS